MGKLSKKGQINHKIIKIEVAGTNTGGSRIMSETNEQTHVLIYFDADNTYDIREKHIVGSIRYGKIVLKYNGKWFTGKVLHTGTKEECEEKQNEHKNSLVTESKTESKKVKKRKRSTPVEELFIDTDQSASSPTSSLPASSSPTSSQPKSPSPTSSLASSSPLTSSSPQLSSSATIMMDHMSAVIRPPNLGDTNLHPTYVDADQLEQLENKIRSETRDEYKAKYFNELKNSMNLIKLYTDGSMHFGVIISNILNKMGEKIFD